MTVSARQSNILRAVRQRGSCTIVADSSKFDRVALAQLCPLDRLDILVTEAYPCPDLVRALDPAGVDIEVAGDHSPPPSETKDGEPEQFGRRHLIRPGFVLM